MFIESEELKDGDRVDADVCIVGAGAAGISLAREFDDSGLNVVVVESGGLDYEAPVQELYRGELIGRDYYPLHVTRLRMFGGSTAHWGGFSRIFDDMDFERRPWVEGSGWPFGLDELRPYYARAQRLCELGPLDYETERWERPGFEGLPLNGSQLQTGVFQNSTPTRFGEVYREQLGSSRTVRVLLHATALEVSLHPDGRRVDSMRLGNLSGKRFEVTARRYVLALGGLENPRLLLNSTSVQRKGIGNQADLVGRYFMEHPIMETGELLLTRPDAPADIYRRRTIEGTPVQGFVTARHETLRTRKMLNCGMLLKSLNWADSSDGAMSVREIMESFGERRMPDGLLDHVSNIVTDIDGVVSATYNKLRSHRLFEVVYWAESVPNPDSRVRLTDKKDAFGKPRISLDWRLTAQDRLNLHAMHRLVGEELGRTGLGRLHLSFDPEQGWPAELRGSHHHMGTTRMAEDPGRGVVDADCRVHGVDNLYVSGSSVFPTAGQANPTLTLVALALRLADHLRRESI